MGFLPMRRFQSCVRRYDGDYKVQTFSCLEQFLCMAFAPLTYRESLRDIEATLHAAGAKRYPRGLRSPVSRSTWADANEARDWRIYADFAQTLIGIAQPWYAGEDLGLDLDATVYALDSSPLDLCRALFPWARYPRKPGAIKLHTLLNLRGSIPEFIHISDGKLQDVNLLDLLAFVPGAFYVMDRGDLDFARLYAVHQALAFFVTRARRRFQFQRPSSCPVDHASGLRCDPTVITTGKDRTADYPQPLRRIAYFDAQHDRRRIFLTNNFDLPALTIARLYKARWHVELFFKWSKQPLRIQAFYGTSPHAVQTQVWIAIAVYVRVAILKKRLALPQSLYTILQVLSVTILEKTPILQAFAEARDATEKDGNYNPPILFDL
jgi:hypothetical protein